MKTPQFLLGYILLISALTLGSMLGAAAQAAAPGVSSSDATLKSGEIRPIVDSHYIAWDGRMLGVMEVGMQGGITDAFSAGAAYRETIGHGRTSTNRYAGNGWQAWGAMRLLPETETHPGVSLVVTHIADAVYLHSTTSTSTFTANPSCASDGVEARASGVFNGRAWQGKAGVYRTMVNALPVATVTLLGGGTTVPLGPHLTLQPSLTAFHDDLDGGRYNAGLSIALCGTPAKNANITLAGSLFARGIPLAGTPLSVPSAIGVDYGSNATAQLHTQAAGYLSLSADYRF